MSRAYHLNQDTASLRLKAMRAHIQREYGRLHAAGVIASPFLAAEALASGVPAGSLGAVLTAQRVHEEHVRRTGGASPAGNGGAAKPARTLQPSAPRRAGG